jgi:hypothetical protein
MSLIKAAGAGDQSTGFYKHLLDQSLKFNDGDSQYLTRTPASAGNRKTWTWSAWVKLGHIPADGDVLFAGEVTGSGNMGSLIRFYDKQIAFLNWESSGGARYFQVRTNRLFRDTSAWYHIVVALDTTQSTAANRVKIYVNGTQETSLSATQYGSQNDDLAINNTVNHYLGAGSSAGTVGSYFDGYIAEVNLIDGTALDASSFGETVEGIWTPKDTSGLTFGTNGFHLTFKDDVISEGFNTVTYSGTGAAQSISGLGFSPAFVWVKVRDGTNNHRLFDVVRGPTKDLISNSTSSESTTSVRLQSFDGDGFTVGSNAEVNASGGDIVAWCWEAGGAPTADNSASAGATPTSNSVKIDGSNLGSALAGSIAATRLSADTSKGFSIVTYTGNYTAGATVAHGLGAAPKWILIKKRGGADDWFVYHDSLGETKGINLTTAAAFTGTVYNDTAPTSSVFSLGQSNGVNENSQTFVAYCWAEVSGYSKFDSYTGDGTTDGSKAITTGFRPSFVMMKNASASGTNWLMFDSTRDAQPTIGFELNANNTNVEGDNGRDVTFTSTGFTVAGNNNINGDGNTHIYMAFADTREAAFFKDVTTNGNHWTPVNLDYRDSVPDVPTNSFCTANPLHKRLDGTVTVSEGNLQISAGSGYGGDNRFAGTTGVSSGKWYFEMLRTDATGLGNQTATGVFDADTALSSGAYSGNGTNSGAASNEWALTDRGYACNTSTYTNLSGTIGTVAQNKVVQVAVDMDNKKIWFGIDNTFSGDPAAGSGEAFSNLPTTILPMLYTAQSTQVFNFGQDSSFAGNHATANSNADGNGHGSFAYAPPSGFLALCSQNLPDVAIIDGSDYFNTVLYTGNNTDDHSITGVGFASAPDFTWIKRRDGSAGHQLYDSVRGATERLQSDSTDAESTQATGLKSFDSDGFTLGTLGGSNGNTETFAAWNWLAGTAFSNDASATSVGTIDSSGQVNTTAGFSIVSYTGNSSTDGQTVAHGLSSAPEMVIIKNRSNARNWRTYHSALGATKYINLDETAAAATYGSFNDTAPTSTVFSTTDSDADRATNYNSDNYIAYCFHSVEGYSKVGSYTGNGNADGTFVYTGFRPAWILFRAAAVGHWIIFDVVRHPSNVNDARLYANLTNAEDSSYSVDLLSNGFKLRHTGSDFNSNGGTYIYLAFAESPFKFANAR